MLLRLITAISLIQFILLMVSGAAINTALYRSLLVFMILFVVVYLSVFFLNIIQQNPKAENPSLSEEQNPVNHKE